MFQRANRSALVRDPTIFWWFHHVCDIAEQRGPGSGGPSQGRESRPQPGLRQSLYTAARATAEPPAARTTAELIYRSPGYGRAARSPGYGRACIPQPGLQQSRPQPGLRQSLYRSPGYGRACTAVQYILIITASILGRRFSEITNSVSRFSRPC